MSWVQVKFGYPDDWSIVAKIAREREVCKWCRKHFPDGNWYVSSSGVMDFKDEKEAMLFALKWA